MGPDATPGNKKHVPGVSKICGDGGWVKGEWVPVCVVGGEVG